MHRNVCKLKQSACFFGKNITVVPRQLCFNSKLGVCNCMCNVHIEKASKDTCEDVGNKHIAPTCFSFTIINYSVVCNVGINMFGHIYKLYLY